MNDLIEPVPKTMEKFFGTSGNMVKPSIKTVEVHVSAIPKGKLAIIDDLRTKIAETFGVERACPASTTKALKILSTEKPDFPYWRIVKKKSELISQFPGGVDGHAQKLKKEGFSIDYSKKNPTAKVDKKDIYKFA